MHVNPQAQAPSSSTIETAAAGLRPASPGALPNPRVKESPSQTFSGNEIKTAPGGSGATGAHTLSAKGCSPEFAKAYSAAWLELDTMESRFYQQALGWVSAGADAALNQLKNIVGRKSATSLSGGLGEKSGFPASPLIPREHQLWQALLDSLPAAYRNYLQASEANRSDHATYSPEFLKAYQTAQQALGSKECQFYEDQLGWLSPDAEKAVDQLRAIVSSKYESSPSANAAKESFSMKPLTPDEHQAWVSLVHALPPVYKTALPKSSNWREAEPLEVLGALTQDAAMRTLMEEQPAEFTRFYNELTGAINRKMHDMSDSDKGMAITFRFPQCYTTTAHIAVAGVWRDEHGVLKIGFCHQESMPPKSKGQPWSGVVYPGFDTARDYPGGHAPVLESMRLAGPPAANVFPCPHPEAIMKATGDIAGPQKARQYAPTYTWISAAGQQPAPLPPETCFNVTHKVLAAMYYTDTHDQPLLPTLLPKMASFASIGRHQFDAIETGKPGQVIVLETIPTLPFAEQVKAFLRVGMQWGEALPWDVELQTWSRVEEAPVSPGKIGIILPPGARGIKFLSGAEHMTLHGQAGRPGKTYSAAEAAMMVCQAKNPATVRFVTSLPRVMTSNAGAKL